jgi:hypothetical protein
MRISATIGETHINIAAATVDEATALWVAAIERLGVLGVLAETERFRLLAGAREAASVLDPLDVDGLAVVREADLIDELVQRGWRVRADGASAGHVTVSTDTYDPNADRPRVHDQRVRFRRGAERPRQRGRPHGEGQESEGDAVKPMAQLDAMPIAINTADRGIVICVPATAQMRTFLAELVDMGLFGRDVGEVAERFVCDRLLELINEGTFLGDEDDDA